MLGAFILAIAEVPAIAQVTAAATSSPAAVQPVPTPCSRSAAGSVVHQPAALFSQNGVLSVQFSYQTTTDTAGRTLYCFMTPSGLENPTLHVKPGDHLIITLTNNTTKQPVMMTIDSPYCGPGVGQMTASSVNIHYHGTNTSPTCHSDEVIKTLVNYQQTFQYNVAFPANEPPGLYWYHPHVHGNAEHAVLGGAAGALVVDGIEDVQPAVSGLRQRILVLRDQPTVQSLLTPPVTESPGGTPNGVPFQDLTVNNITTNTFTDASGNTSYTPAVLHMEPGEKQFWRVSNSTSDTILDLQVQFDGVPQTFQVVAIDGVPVNSQDGTPPNSLIAETHFRLPPASRVEFLVNAPSASVSLAQLVTLNILTGTNGDDDPSRPIFNIQLVAQDNDEPATDDRVGQFTALNPNQKRFAGLAAAPIAAKRVVFFNEIQPTSFFMDVQGQPEGVFNPNAAPAITATQGTVEEWTVENHTLENHEFHFHQLHFLVESQNNFDVNGDPLAPAIKGQYLDMIEVPNWNGDPNTPFPSVTLRIDFRGHDVGIFVFHCHILNHEDLGMMNIIQVVPATTASSTKWAPPQSDGNGTIKIAVPAKAPRAATTSTMGTERMKMD
jgi:FtsP/CotA-like multicopper oxidase with cupredoxin domain